jgi:hypothetical protein
MPSAMPPDWRLKCRAWFEAEILTGLICFPVSEEGNRNEYRHDPGNGANDYWLHERRLKTKNTLKYEPKQSDQCSR